MQEPYDLPFPDDRWPQGRPAYAVVVDQLRGWFPSTQPSLAEPWKPAAPTRATRKQTWKPNHDPARK